MALAVSLLCPIGADQPHRIRIVTSDVARVDPTLIGAAQVCDEPARPPAVQYAYNVFDERQIPGEGELPVAAFLAALPADVVVGIEVPLKSLADASVSSRERARRNFTATRLLMAEEER